MKQKTAYSVIIFDLDGTLINTAPDVRLAINKTLALYNQPGINLSEIYPLLGRGVTFMMEKSFLKIGMALNKSEIKKTVANYLNFYRECPVVDTEIYPGVVEVLSVLKKNGVRLGICTNKPSTMTMLILDRLGLTPFFEAILAGEDVKYPKPDGRHIHEVLKKMDSSNLKAVMVGDTSVDMAAAEDAGIPFIGVSYGYEGNKLNSKCLINSILDLPTVLNTISLREEKIS